jgi:hypothetical protein
MNCINPSSLELLGKLLKGYISKRIRFNRILTEPLPNLDKGNNL